jgi:hypothetical protein
MEDEELTCPKAVSDISDANASMEIRVGTLRFIIGFLLWVEK